MYNIYGIYNSINGKIYIGITNNSKRRWYEHKKNSKKITKNSYTLHRAMLKYGIDNFIFKIIENVDDVYAANLRESAWIKLLKNSGYQLYNCTSGGYSPNKYSHNWTEHQKQEASKRLSGSNNPMFGIHLFGCQNGNYGKPMKQHVKDKLISYRRKLNDNQIIEIIKLFNTGNYTQTQLSKNFDVSLTQIHRIVHGKSWGNKKHDAILTKKNLKIDDIKKIKKMCKENKYTKKYIAQIYNISLRHLYKILSREKWSNIE